jgi:flagellar biosynthesis protein FlhF
MKVKTYRAASLKAALKEIKRELGPDAFILGQKEVRPRSLLGKIQKTQVEVTAAVDHSGDPATDETTLPKDTNWIDAVRDEVRITGPLPPGEGGRRPGEGISGLSNAAPQAAPENLVLLDEVRKLKAMVRSISSHRQQPAVFLKPRKFSSPARKHLYSRLSVRGIDEDLAYSLISAEEASAESVAANLAGRVSLFPDFIRNAAAESGSEIVALLGPTGVGKTTTIAKIAAIAALQKSLKVGLLTLDTYRIAAIAQLKTYAEIMGVPLRVVENVQGLRSAIEAFSDRDLILIDTTGRNHREVCHEWELADFLAESETIRKALVASATTRPSDLTDIVERHGIFKPNCLIFTKLDETETHGTIVSELIRSGLPLAYVTVGQGVPQDILKPEARQLVDLALGADPIASWNHFVDAARSIRQQPQHSARTQKASRRLG